MRCRELLRFNSAPNGVGVDMTVIGMKALLACDVASRHLSDTITYYSCCKPSSMTLVCHFNIVK